MKTAIFYLDAPIDACTPEEAYCLSVEVVDSEEPAYPQRVTLVFYGLATEMPDTHPLYYARQTGMLPPGHVPCRSWDRAEEFVRDFLQQAGCPVDQHEVYVYRPLLPPNFHKLFGWETPPTAIKKTTIRERIRDLYYKACAFLA